jgi:hypothetical protein
MNKKEVSAQPHAGVALGVVGIRDSEWARQVDPAGRFPGGNVRVADHPDTERYKRVSWDSSGKTALSVSEVTR